MILTKAGLKLWVSGMLVLVCTFVLGLLMTPQVIEYMSLWELAFVFLVVYPLILGWVQRWYWTPKAESDSNGIQL